MNEFFKLRGARWMRLLGTGCLVCLPTCAAGAPHSPSQPAQPRKTGARTNPAAKRSVPAAASAAQLLEEAQKALAAGGLQAAVDLLLKAKAMEPQNMAVRYYLGYGLFRQRRLQQSRAEFLEVVKAAPPALYSRYFLGRIAILQNRPKEAIQWLAAVVASDQPIFDAADQLGKAYANAGEPQKAAEVMQIALRQAPWDGGLHYRLARIFQQLNQPRLAAEEFRTSRRLRAADLQTVAKLLECSQHLGSNQREAALRDRRELLADPDVDPDALVSLGVLFGSAGMDAEALDPFRRAAQKKPDIFQAQFNAGFTLLKLSRPAEAAAFLRQAVQLLPDSYEANSALALAQVSLRRYKEAISPLEAALKVRPDNPRVSGLLGMCYIRSDSPARGIEVLKGALAKSTQDPKLYFLLVEGLQAAKDEEDALRVAEEAVRRFPDNATAQFAVAQQLVRIGRYRDSAPFFQKASELAPDDINSLLGLGEVLQKKGEYEAALATYQRALEKNRQDLDAQLGVGRNLALLQRFEEARKILEEAIGGHPDSAALRFELAKVYARLGDSERAAEQTRIFQQLRAKESPAPGKLAPMESSRTPGAPKGLVKP